MLGRYSVRYFSTLRHTHIGFIGLGNMGFPMMTHCVKHGYTVTAYDTNTETLERAEALGAIIAPDIKECAIEQDVVFTMLPNTDAVEEARLGSNGIFEHAKEGTLVVDSSTISPIASKKMTEEGDKFGVRVVDAPVSGGTGGATNGTLTFMVGCNSEDFDEVKEFLDPMAGNVFHCGKPGNGQIAKVWNNLALAIQMISVSESLALGQKLGMDPKALTDIMKTSSSNCWSLNTYNPVPGVMDNVPSSNNYEGGFGVSLIKKDLSIALDCATQADIDLGFGNKSIEYYHDIERKGEGKKDFGVVFRYISELKKKTNTTQED